MKVDLPPHLESTRQMLSASLRLRPTEKAPAVPAGLLQELSERFSTQQVVVEAPKRRIWLLRLRSMVSTPAFGLAAAAVFVLGVFTPILGGSSGAPREEVFRGTPVDLTYTPVRIVLVSGPADIGNTLAHSGQFEPAALLSMGTYEAALELNGPKVIVNFENATIYAHRDGGGVAHTAELPSDIADLVLSVSDAVSRL